MADPSEITRFVSPRPKYKPTDNVVAKEVMTPHPKDTTPSPSVVARVAGTGNVDLAALVARTQQAAREAAQAAARDYTPRPRKGKEVAVPKAPVPLFQPQDVVSDLDFIKLTRTIDIHSEQAKRLFHANGGTPLLAMLSYAQAFDMLRKQKMQKPAGANLPTYHRTGTVPEGMVAVSPGIPTSEDRMLAEEAREEAKRVVINEKWAGIDPKGE